MSKHSKSDNKRQQPSSANKARSQGSQMLDTAQEKAESGIDNLKEQGRGAATEAKSKAKNVGDKTRR